VGTAAEIHERSVRVGRDDLVVAQLGEALELERVIDESLLGLGSIHLFTHERILLRRDLAHLVLERGNVFRGERLGDLEVVVKAVVDRRAEADLRVGAQSSDRCRENVRGGVSQHVE
jgi:hypothetical protein